MKQLEVAKLIREKYPNVWAELDTIGVEETSEGSNIFKIDREVIP